MSFSRHLVSRNRLIGATVYFHLDADAGLAFFETEYDPEMAIAAKDMAAAIRNDGQSWARGVKAGFASTAILPPEVRHAWRQMGIDPDSADPDMRKKVRQLLNGDYKALKTTDARL